MHKELVLFRLCYFNCSFPSHSFLSSLLGGLYIKCFFPKLLNYLFVFTLFNKSLYCPIRIFIILSNNSHVRRPSTFGHGIFRNISIISSVVVFSIFTIIASFICHLILLLLRRIRFVASLHLSLLPFVSQIADRVDVADILVNARARHCIHAIPVNVR